MPLKCVTLPLAASTFTHIRQHALKACAEEKGSFCICGCCYLFKQQQREQCDVSNHICYASRSILPTRRGPREGSGTVEQQPSLECMCHCGINSEPWLMFCICSHPSQRSENTGPILSGLNWSSSRDSWCNVLRGLWRSAVLVLWLCTYLSKCAEERCQLMCLLKACCFVNSDAPGLHHAGWTPGGGATERGGRVCEQGWVTAPCFMERCREKTDRDREVGMGGDCGGRVTASVASQCPRQEERELCAADCLTETLAAGWWHFMVTTCNPTNSLAGENPVFKHWMALDSCCCSCSKNDTHICICFNSSQNPEPGFAPYGGIIYSVPSRICCESKSRIRSIMHGSITW